LARKKEAASVYSEDYLEAKKIRDQAFTPLKEAVDKIRKCGQFVFWRNPGRVKGYRSNYLRRLNRRSTEDNNEPDAAPDPVPDTETETVTTPA